MKILEEQDNTRSVENSNYDLETRNIENGRYGGIMRTIDTRLDFGK